MIYIDVRTPAEYAEGHYPGAINHPVESIMQGVMPDIPRDTEISLYCRTGARADFALEIMRQSGFTHVTNAGGLDDLGL